MSLFGVGVANAIEINTSNVKDIRGPIISGISGVVITPTDFSGFWYDIDEGIGSEVLTIYNMYGRTIPEVSLFYRSSIVQIGYEADFASDDSSIYSDTYPVIGLFGKDYVATDDDDAGELVPLLLDTGDKYTLRTDSVLELPDGYELTAKQIDVEGDKVLMEFSKDGELIENEILDVTSGEVTWDYARDVGNQDDVIVFRVLITDIFQGQVDDLVVIEGLWLLDFEDILEVEPSDEFGELEVDSVSDTIVMYNQRSLALSMGDTVDIAENMKIKIADDNDLRFYLMKECTEQGMHELRGTVVTGPSAWNGLNFSGFMYDLDNNIYSEGLEIIDIYSRSIAAGSLVYTTSVVQADYNGEFNDEDTVLYNTTYPVVGLFGEKYVSLSDTDPDELVKLLVDDGGNYSLRTDSIITLPEGFELTVKQIDVADDTVLMELSKDGVFIEDKVIDTTASPVTWDYSTAVGGQAEVIVLRVHVSDVSEDATGGFAIVDGLYLLDYKDILSVGSGDEFEWLVVDTILDGTITMYNSDTIILNEGNTIEFAPGMNLQVADDPALRYYPFVESYNEQETLMFVSFSPSKTIEGSESTSQLFRINLNQAANITWFLDDVNVQSTLSSTNSSYYALPPSYGEHAVKVVASNENGSATTEWEWLIKKDPRTVDEFEFRSSVISTVSDIIIRPTDFSGFWYDVDNGIGSECITIYNIYGRSIPQGELWYNVSIVQMGYEADFASEDASVHNDTYPVLGLFGNKYVATADDDAGELVRLLVDTDDKYTLRAGSTLDLANGYELTAQQIDVEGDKVLMELSRDGEFIEDHVIDITVGEATWDYKRDVGDQNDVIVFRLLITDIFQGSVDDLVVVEGLWLLDFDNILEVDPSDKFGELEVDSISDSITMLNHRSLTLNRSDTVNIAEGLEFKVADDDDLRFYLMEECTEQGVHQLRGAVATGSSSWTALNFAGFMYDLDNDIRSEELTIINSGPVLPDEGGLSYTTSIVQAEYAAEFNVEDTVLYNTTYPVIGLFGEEYVSLSDTDPGELAKLLVDSSYNYTLRTGSVLDLPNGYELTAKQIDVEEDKVWMDLSKDGVFVEDEVIDVTGGEATWDYDPNVGSQNDVIVSRVHINEVSEDGDGSFVVVDGLYLIDHQDIVSVDAGDEFGELFVDTTWGGTIKMYNSRTLLLSEGDIIEFAPGMYLQVADDPYLRYYPFVECKIEGTIPNEMPVATISSMSPNPASENEYVSFTGLGNDVDGIVTGYNWRSSIDGYLNNSASFSTNALSPGVHTIYFKVQDDDDAWSEEVSSILTINEGLNGKPLAIIDSISPDPSNISEVVDFAGSGTDIDGYVVAYNWRSDIDGQLNTSSDFSTSSLSAGEHTIYFKVQDNDGAWSSEVSDTIVVDDGDPLVGISVGFESNISVNNPVDITLNSSDMYLLKSEFQIVNSSGHVVFTQDLTNHIVSGEYSLTLYWNTSDSLGKAVPSGTYTMSLISYDELGNSASKDVIVVVDNTVPVISIDEIIGHVTQGSYVYSSSSLVVNTSVSEDVNFVGYTLDLVPTDNGVSINAELINNKWSAEFDLSSLDEGHYNLSATASDPAMNTNSTISETLVVVDHTSPAFSSITSQYNETHRNVTVSVSENLTETPQVAVNSDSITVYQDGSKWTGYFPRGTDIVFYVNVKGTDLAGNIGESTSVMYFETMVYGNGTGIFNSSEFGMSIIFNGTNDTTGSIIVTESTQPMEDLNDGSIGLYFFNVELDEALAENMSGALIAIPTDPVVLPDGMTKEDVSIRYYNETSYKWDNCSTSIDIINGKECWTAYVSHFSTYGITVFDIPESDDPIDIGSSVSSSGSGSSGGGGGGGGTTGEKYENILVKDVLNIFVNKDSHVNYEFTKDGNAISSVQFDSLKNSGKISTIVEVLKGRSSFADLDAPGTVYQQMNIWVGKSGFVTPENVENLLITFKVERSWLEENNIVASTVHLYRYTDGSWNALPTSVTEEDDEFVHFESETPGFSPFVIGSEAEVTDIVEEDTKMSVGDESTEDITVEGDSETSGSSTGILAILGGISVLLVGAYVMYSKRS
ncbi:S-layer protein domain-containing protein [Methanolobus profundi]|uniref:S-layer family duplication domain-containing protein n=1 Tax=Methanolobus profundi TaxID=487685 RepID=A0A1I4SV67_9EURY|nr:S-layer protein domain-containing protein [Methanolobus profundi]SFM68305.1 S-layer family duplication domain-containing protein [Methanolobus profundi]